jgi:outer membrane immunogenic protein
MVAAATLAASLASAAYAQDDEQPFNGIYVGVSGGYDLQSNDVGSRIQFDRNGDGNFNDAVTTTTGANAFSTGFCDGRAFNAIAAQGCENDRNKASYYARVGADSQTGKLVIGVYGEFGKSEIKDFVSAFSTTPANYIFARSLRWEASVRGRAGLAFGTGANAGMFYGTGGVGYADIRHRFETTNTANAFAGNNDGKKKFGFIVGGGVEKFITRNISFGLEYTYHDYKDDNYFINVTRGTAAATNPFVLAPNTAGTTFRRSDPDFRWHSLRAGLNFRF